MLESARPGSRPACTGSRKPKEVRSEQAIARPAGDRGGHRDVRVLLPGIHGHRGRHVQSQGASGAAGSRLGSASPAIVAGSSTDLWIYTFGPLIGGSAAGVLYGLLRRWQRVPEVEGLAVPERGESPASPDPLRDLVALQELPGDHQLLDLAGALSNQQERGVAVQALDRVLGAVAVSAVDAEGLGHDLVAGLGAEVLGHAGLEVAALAGRLLLGGLEQHQA